MKTKKIKQIISFTTSPLDTYNLIMDPKKHSAFSGSVVKMSDQINGKFEVFDSYCKGYNIELEKGKKIIQAWNFKEDGWPADYYSICTFNFQPNLKGTKLTFTQTGVPEHKYESLKQGWKEFYWAPMKKYIDQSLKK